SKAVEKAIELKPFAITLDIMMPQVDGWQVLHELKQDERTRDIPILVCSILEEEDNRRRLIRRLKRVIHAHGGAWPDDAYLRISVKAGLRIDDPKWREVLEWEISNFRPEFCYLDVFNRLHSKDINDASEMTEIILFLDRLAREYQVTFIILHHTRKMTGMGDSHDEIIGSRVLGGFTEATMFLSPTKEKGVLRVKVSLKDEPEDGTFEQEFQIKLTDTQDGLGTHFEYLGAPPEKQASLELREKIKNFVLSQDHPVRIKDVSAGVGVSKNTVRDHLDSLTDLKILDRVKDGQALTYSPITPLNLKKGMDQ
ncbi:MAG: AAA family ATPase, partial [Nitrospirae bacterium]|nr:AAA family ATPase [Nitrospirota bacterium]